MGHKRSIPQNMWVRLKFFSWQISMSHLDDSLLWHISWKYQITDKHSKLVYKDGQSNFIHREKWRFLIFMETAEMNSIYLITNSIIWIELQSLDWLSIGKWRHTRYMVLWALIWSVVLLRILEVNCVVLSKCLKQPSLKFNSFILYFMRYSDHFCRTRNSISNRCLGSRCRK